MIHKRDVAALHISGPLDDFVHHDVFEKSDGLWVALGDKALDVLYAYVEDLELHIGKDSLP